MSHGIGKGAFSKTYVESCPSMRSENTTPTTFSKNFALRSHCIILLLAANEMIIISSICAKLGVFIHKNQDANLRVLLAFLKV